MLITNVVVVAEAVAMVINEPGRIHLMRVAKNKGANW